MSSQNHTVPTERPVILFDGVCVLCNSSVNFIMKRDKKQVFLFAANQSEAGRRLLGAQPGGSPDTETLYLYHQDRLYDRSTAVLHIMRLLGFPYHLAWFSLLVPRVIRDWVYDFVAQHRYAWFGKKDLCRMPTAEERARFLE